MNLNHFLAVFGLIVSLGFLTVATGLLALVNKLHQIARVLISVEHAILVSGLPHREGQRTARPEVADEDLLPWQRTPKPPFHSQE
jgi:hypothetical protein